MKHLGCGHSGEFHGAGGSETGTMQCIQDESTILVKLVQCYPKVYLGKLLV